ncbi:TolC family protein [Shewanella sp. YIC-542]|uniref:TolC family protein n=1 Tax=Shewanella mytili TaxID=3377111 RepID=UPI00398F8858
MFSIGKQQRRNWRVLVAACAFMPMFSFAAAEVSTLKQALALTLQQYPELQKFSWLIKAQQSEQTIAAQSPEYRVDVGVENLFGTGAAAGVQGAQTTLSLSSVIELGDKRALRKQLAAANLAATEAAQLTQTLEVMSTVTQQYIHTLAQQQRVTLNRESVELAQHALAIVTKRVSNGAANNAEQLQAQAAVSQAQLALSNELTMLAVMKQQLAAFWRADADAISQLSGTLTPLTGAPNFSALYRQFLISPYMATLSQSVATKDAELSLVRSQARPDIGWSVGVSRQQEQQDTSLVANVSIPLYSAARNQARTQIAIASKHTVELQRQMKLLEYKQYIYEASQYLHDNLAAIEQLQSTILPNLTQAMQLSLSAYQRGSYGYQDYIAAREALLQAKRQQLDLLEAALINQTLLEQWTGAPLSVSSQAY